MGGHLGAQGSLVLDCGMSRPTDQGALPHSSEAWEPTLGILPGVGAPGPAAPSLSPCQSLEREKDWAGKRKRGALLASSPRDLYPRRPQLFQTSLLVPEKA